MAAQGGQRGQGMDDIPNGAHLDNENVQGFIPDPLAGRLLNGECSDVALSHPEIQLTRPLGSHLFPPVGTEGIFPEWIETQGDADHFVHL